MSSPADPPPRALGDGAQGCRKGGLASRVLGKEEEMKGMRRALVVLGALVMLLGGTSQAIPNCDPIFNGDMDDTWFELEGKQEEKFLNDSRVRERSGRARVFVHSWSSGCNEMIFDIYSRQEGEWTLVETLYGVRVFPGANGNQGILTYPGDFFDGVPASEPMQANGDGLGFMTLGGFIRLVSSSSNRMSMDIWILIVQEGSTRLLRLKGSSTRAPGWYQEPV